MRRCGLGVLACVLWALACSEGDDGDATGSDGGDAGLQTNEGTDAAADPDAAADVDAGDGDPCPDGVLDGDYVAESDEDAAAIAGCTEITGDLSITGGVTTLDLDALTSIGGSLGITDTTALTGVELPALVSVLEDCSISGNAELASFAAPALESAAALVFTQNTALAEVDVEALAECGYIGVQFDDELASFSAPSIETIGVFIVTENAKITSVRFDALTTITVDGFIVSRNPMLETLSVPELQSVYGEIAVNDNPLLPMCQVDDIRSRIDTMLVPFTSSGNDDTATCP